MDGPDVDLALREAWHRVAFLVVAAGRAMAASVFALSMLYLEGGGRYRKSDTTNADAGRCKRERGRLGSCVPQLQKEDSGDAVGAFQIGQLERRAAAWQS